MPERPLQDRSDHAPLELEDLGHRFEDGRPVFERVNLSVAPGELVAVLGASGSGKSTLLRAVAGFVTPSAGAVRVHGEIVASEGRELVPAERRRVGMVFQDYALFPHMTVRENLAFGLPSRAGREDRLQELLSAGGLDALRELTTRRPAQLSGGQRQRVALARALAPRPRLILLDEPFANLDAELRFGLGAEVRRILHTEGVSGLLVTHDQACALGLADRVAVLGRADDADGGAAHLLQIGTPEEVYRRPRTRRVAALTGPVAFLEARGEGRTAATDLGEVTLGAEVTGAATLAVRPDQVRFREEPGGSCTVTHRCFQGTHYALRLQTPAGELQAVDFTDCAPSEEARGTVVIEGTCWPLESQGGL